jgi:hypothetical protein
MKAVHIATHNMSANDHSHIGIRVLVLALESVKGFRVYGCKV